MLLFFIRASHLRQEQRQERTGERVLAENGLVRFYLMSERRRRFTANIQRVVGVCMCVLCLHVRMCGEDSRYH